MAIVRLYETAAPKEDTILAMGFELSVVPNVGDDIALEVGPGEIVDFKVVSRTFELTSGEDGAGITLFVERVEEATASVSELIF